MWNHTFKTNFIICLSMSLGTRFVSCATSKTSILTLYKQDEAIWPLYTIPRITARATVHRLPSLHPTLPYWSFSVRHLLTMAQDYSLKLVHKGNQIRLKLKLFCSQHFTFFFFFFTFCVHSSTFHIHASKHAYLNTQTCTHTHTHVHKLSIQVDGASCEQRYCTHFLCIILNDQQSQYWKSQVGFTLLFLFIWKQKWNLTLGRVQALSLRPLPAQCWREHYCYSKNCYRATSPMLGILGETAHWAPPSSSG